MWRTFRSVIEDDFIDEEDIIAKIQYLENQTSRHQYLLWGNHANPFSARVTSAIQALPEEHRKAALALFANIVYVPKPILDEAWREVAFTLEKLYVNGYSPDFRDSFYFAVDNPGLVTNFSHIAGLKGREDHDVNPGFNSVSDIIDRLYNLVEKRYESADIKDIIILMKKKNWVILSDNSISGGSLISDVKKLLRIKSILFPSGLIPLYAKTLTTFSPPELFVGVQIITEQAFSELDEIIPANKVAYGLKFDDTVRISSDKCKLFRSEETLKSVRNLCEWFGNKYFLNQTDLNFRKRIEIHVNNGGKENYAYGWKDCGYTIVTQDNALSNSVPIIYYTPPMKLDSENEQIEGYIPPFSRVESRVSHTTSQDKDKLREVEQWINANFIRRLIYGNIEV